MKWCAKESLDKLDSIMGSTFDCGCIDWVKLKKGMASQCHALIFSQKNNEFQGVGDGTRLFVFHHGATKGCCKIGWLL